MYLLWHAGLVRKSFLLKHYSIHRYTHINLLVQSIQFLQEP
ncbi:hypothetical protein BCAH1134_C0139 (plasmid) [Bacillus cereus AH1134]|nr:hypothetical protein BCAH1134_C0139 [Bacillus cereus AH1134]